MTAEDAKKPFGDSSPPQEPVSTSSPPSLLTKSSSALSSSRNVPSYSPCPPEHAPPLSSASSHSPQGRPLGPGCGCKGIRRCLLCAALSRYSPRAPAERQQTQGRQTGGALESPDVSSLRSALGEDCFSAAGSSPSSSPCSPDASRAPSASHPAGSALCPSAASPEAFNSAGACLLEAKHRVDRRPPSFLQCACTCRMPSPGPSLLRGASERGDEGLGGQQRSEEETSSAVKRLPQPEGSLEGDEERQEGASGRWRKPTRPRKETGAPVQDEDAVRTPRRGGGDRLPLVWAHRTDSDVKKKWGEQGGGARAQRQGECGEEAAAFRERECLTLCFLWCPRCRALHRQVAEPACAADLLEPEGPPLTTARGDPAPHADAAAGGETGGGGTRRQGRSENEETCDWLRSGLCVRIEDEEEGPLEPQRGGTVWSEEEARETLESGAPKTASPPPSSFPIPFLTNVEIVRAVRRLLRGATPPARETHAAEGPSEAGGGCGSGRGDGGRLEYGEGVTGGAAGNRATAASSRAFARTPLWGCSRGGRGEAQLAEKEEEELLTRLLALEEDAGCSGGAAAEAGYPVAEGGGARGTRDKAQPPFVFIQRKDVSGQPFGVFLLSAAVTREEEDAILSWADHAAAGETESGKGEAEEAEEAEEARGAEAEEARGAEAEEARGAEAEEARGAEAEEARGAEAEEGESNGVVNGVLSGGGREREGAGCGLKGRIPEEHGFWALSQSGRRKIDFGPKVNFKKKRVKVGKFNGLPPFAERLLSPAQPDTAPESLSPPASTPVLSCDSSSRASSAASAGGASSLPAASSPGHLCGRPYSAPGGEASRAFCRTLLSDFQPVELCLLEYSPNRGSHIEEHFDDCWLWGPRLVTFNLVSAAVLAFTSPAFCVPREAFENARLQILARLPAAERERDARSHGRAAASPSSAEACPQAPHSAAQAACGRVQVEVRFVLPPRSLVVFEGHCRYTWAHAIRPHHIFSRRVAVTLRELAPEFLPGGKSEEVGQTLLSLAASFCGSPVNDLGKESA
ncbi:hypothetical protein BESB_006610 [Besnoitia besnoiti]|uniref:Alpha-ketoglutarate-dependent dioxygenase AlkB-like domain-containing protein n=1 Tax=Besnoitia besnoiti TaxID=94643 RepID=A0A2A9MQI9_BESBE|nr:hypothetical protein BESB_006610 [Besnoitia besnoiti]PFH38320.1 hypothetical protein BESB_006610 [Besnoitia besnoiti]